MHLHTFPRFHDASFLALVSHRKKDNQPCCRSWRDKRNEKVEKKKLFIMKNSSSSDFPPSHRGRGRN